MRQATAKGEIMYTVEDIQALPEGVRAELIDGEIFYMASPSWTHQSTLMWLSTTIFNFIRENQGKCQVLPAPFGVFIKKDNKNYVEPDVSVICNRDKLDEQGCHGAPEWVMEIVSPNSRTMDYARKLELYNAAGVEEYWIIDANKEVVMVYDLEEELAPVIYRFEDKIRSKTLPELELDMSELKTYLAG